MRLPKTKPALYWTLSLACLLGLKVPATAGPRRETLAVKKIAAAKGAECTQHLWMVLLRSQRFNVWPDWYLQQHTLTPQAFPIELDYLVEGELAYQDAVVRLSVVMKHHHAGNSTLIFADSRSSSVSELDMLCQEMGYRILGEVTAPPPDSPALAASLSMVIPGAGHFYQGKAFDILLGSLFLGGFLTLTYLGLSPQEEGGLTRQQWGGLLMLLSLSDILSAYFLSMPPRTSVTP